MLVLLLTSELVVYAFQIVLSNDGLFLHFILLVLGDYVGLNIYVCVRVIWWLVKIQNCWATPSSSQFSRSGYGLRICISNKFSDYVDVAGSGNHI